MAEDRDEFAAVYRAHLPAVSAYLGRRVARADVDDLAADTFAIAWRKRAAVAPGEELPWLYRIASYQVANHRRRLAIRVNALAILATPDSAPAADAFLDADPALARAWAGLGAGHREVLALIVLDGLAPGEAATALGITPNAASIRLHRAKRALATALGAERDAEGSDGERSGLPAT